MLFNEPRRAARRVDDHLLHVGDFARARGDLVGVFRFANQMHVGPASSVKYTASPSARQCLRGLDHAHHAGRPIINRRRRSHRDEMQFQRVFFDCRAQRREIVREERAADARQRAGNALRRSARKWLDDAAACPSVEPTCFSSVLTMAITSRKSQNSGGAS